jgi:hypothetical protein
MRSRLVVLAMGCSIVASTRASADDAPKPDLRPLSEEVRKLVEKHYPNAKVTLKDDLIHFEFNARKFMIHEPLLTGEWQDAHEEPGPQKGGIYGDIELHTGPCGGMAAVPQAFDKRYFTNLLLAPYAKKLDHHLLIHLKYPRNVPKEFLEEFRSLMDEFQKHVPARGE